MRVPVAVLGLCAALAACGFQAPDVDDTGDMPATVGFLGTMSLQDEKSGAVDVAIALNAPSAELVSVHYRFSGGTATNGLDYVGSDNTISIPAGSVEAKIPVMILEDGLEEEAETIEITLSDPVNAQLGTSMHTITISRDVLPRVNFTAPSSAMDEGQSPTLTLTLDTPSTDTVSVDYVITGTATATADYGLANGTVEFPPGTTSKDIALAVKDDALDEFDENVLVTLTSSSNVVVGAGASHDHMILDNDNAPTVAFANVTQSKAENGNTVTLTVKLSAPSGKPIMVDVRPAAGLTNPATEGQDFAFPEVSTLMFPAGTTQQTLAVTILDDNVDEFDEQFTALLQVQSSYNVSLGTAIADLVTITDNDPAPTVDFTSNSGSVQEFDTTDHDYQMTVSLSAPSAKPISIPISLSGTASSSSDYNILGTPIDIAPGQTTGAFTVRVFADKSHENDESIVMTIPSGGLTNVTRGNQNSRTITIVDDD